MDQSELIAQFCAVTAADSATAETYLSISNNNLEHAITLFLEGGSASLDSQIRISEQAQSNETTGRDNSEFQSDETLSRELQNEEYSNSLNTNDDEVRERIRPITETLVGPETSGVPVELSSINFRQETPLDSTTSGDEDEVEASTTNSIQDESDYLSNPSDAALAASATLYIPPEDVAQYLDLDSARETAINDRKWVLVNIQQLHDFDSMLLNRDFWTNKEIKKIIQESFVFLQLYNNSSSGREFTQFYPCRKYPHISILEPRTGERVKVWTDIPSADTFAHDLIRFLSECSLDPNFKNPEPELPEHSEIKDVSLMSEEEQIQYAMKLSLGLQNGLDRAEDNDSQRYGNAKELGPCFGGDEIEYTRSSNADKGVTVRSVNKKTENLTSFESYSSVTADSQSLTQPVEYIKETELSPEDLFNSILPQDIPQPSAKDKDSTRIQFRLADGTRILRRFKMSNTIRDIFSVVKQVVDGAQSGYFSLTSQRKKLIDMLDKTIEEAELKNSSILVEMLDDE